MFQVVEILSQVLADLVQGEFMQLQTKQDEEDRFNQKTMTKTATNTMTKIKTNRKKHNDKSCSILQI